MYRNLFIINFFYITNMGIKERFSMFISYKHMSNRKFQESIGVSNSYIQNISKGIGIEVLQKIKSKYPELNENWLLKGEGEMIKKDYKNIEIPESNGITIETMEKYKKAREMGLPLLPEVDFKFAAGKKQLVNGTEDITRYWFLPDCQDCEGVAQVIGRSMSPTLPSGSWVALRRCTIPTDNPNTIPFGNIFGVVVEDECTGEYHGYIKILRRYKDNDMARKCWIAHSINEEEFDDFDIKISQVRGLWIVKQHIVSDILY